ncbi:hypothetical protein CPAS15_0039 [Clostridium phage CPAS-15]|uniref:hypothetical protein n=1 Tax=Enterococcus faecium TaxID=1352 RepID=UPI001463BBCB|nr:hypothetical protein [Enterococcus faecium]QGF20090.1 hypothetical protein CPAS15_0039 [Clostridium phage CPAS-15]
MKTLFNGTDVILIETTNFFIMLQEEGKYVLSKTVDKKMGEQICKLPKSVALVYTNEEYTNSNVEPEPRSIYLDDNFLYEVLGNGKYIIRYSI